METTVQAPAFADMARDAGLERKPYYSIAEAAKATGIGEGVFYREIRGGRIQTFRYGKRGDRILMTPAQIDAWFQEGTR